MFLAADRVTEIGMLPQAMQLAASSSLTTDPTTSENLASTLRAQVATIRSGVQLVTRPNTIPNYTLTSTNAPLPVSIRNTLRVAVYVDIRCDAVGGILGFSADTIHSQRIGAGQTIQVRVPTHLDRTGSIEVEVSISTPAGLSLGPPALFKVRSTALGTVGVVITTVAAVVLLAALLVRVIRRFRSREPKTPQS
jgi:hypothetical protein